MALFIFFKNVLEIGLVVVTFAAVVLIGGRWFLQNYFNDLTEQLVVVSNQKSDVNQRIKHVNHVVKDISLMQKEYASWSPTIRDVAVAIPANISMESMIFDRELQVYTFTGIAKTRTDLLDFQKKLQGLPFIAKVELPLSQLTEKENIPFIITAGVKQE